MSPASRTAAFRDYRNAVYRQIQAGATLGHVEDSINAWPIDEEQKAALWLGAWVRQSQGAWRKFAEPEVLCPTYD